MNQPTARWTTLLATAALVALPALTFAQDPSPAPQSSTAPESAQQTPQAPAPQTSGIDAARSHLTTARNTLSELTQLPAAGQLQGELRTQVAQLINNFNELITTQSDWKTSYAKVDASLDALLAAPAPAPAEDPSRPTGTAGAVGTSGKSAGLDPAIRAKLVKLRGELDDFEKAAGPETAATASSASATASSASPSGAPAATPPAATPSAATSPSTTASTTTSSTTTTTSTTPAANQPPTPAANEPATAGTVTISGKEAIEHIDAIEVMLNGNPLTPEQMAQLKAHLTELRRLIDKQ